MDRNVKKFLFDISEAISNINSLPILKKEIENLYEISSV